MADIDKELSKINSAIYGKDVRNAMHDGLQKVNNENVNRLASQDAIIQNNTIKQDLLEQKYDEQIKELANETPQLPEIVDARQGFETLGLIIKQKIYHFSNVAQMKNCLTLASGDVCRTLGYYDENDGGAGEYKIVNDITLVDNGGSIHNLTNGLKAVLIVKNFVNVRQFGAKGDNIADDTSFIQNALNSKSKVFVPKGTYLIRNITLNDRQEFFGSYGNSIIKSIDGNGSEDLVKTNTSANKCIIKDLIIDGNKMVNNVVNVKRNNGVLNGQFDCKHVLENLEIKNGNGIGLIVGNNVRESRFVNLDVFKNGTHGVYIQGTDNMFSNMSSHSNQKDGIRLTGSNNKLCNSKAYINGLSNEYDDSLPAGLTIIGVLNTITNCEFQENIYDGIKLMGYMNTINGCIVDSNGSDAYDYKYDYAAGIHIVPNNTSRDYATAFNIINGSIISSNHITGQQKYGILIENDKEDNYNENPCFNVINSVVESDLRYIDGVKADMIKFKNDIDNFTNTAIINGVDQHANCDIVKTINNLVAGTYESDNANFRIAETSLNDIGNCLKIKFRTYENAQYHAVCYKTYALFKNNTERKVKGIIVRYKAKTSNCNIAARCNIHGVYYNDDTFAETIPFHNIQEKYLSDTISKEYKDCVAILDMRQFEGKTLKELYVYFGGRIENEITENSGTIEIDFKDIEYYIF